MELADEYLALHQKREEADYDHFAIFTRQKTLLQIARAKAIVKAASKISGADAEAFFGLIAVKMQERRRG
ncbi:MAG TPA: hypothetical protein VKU89_08225 [Solirubrobacteraceae bacterium]|nr:hypothetical protein [Solirubrobacteraceae bacterium]